MNCIICRFNLRSKKRLEKFKNIYLYGFVESFDDIFSMLCGLSLVEIHWNAEQSIRLSHKFPTSNCHASSGWFAG